MKFAFRKKIFLLFIVLLAQIFFVFSFTGEALAVSCKTSDGCIMTNVSQSQCADLQGDYFQSDDCTSPKPKLKLNVPIPGSSYDQPDREYSIDIADYIGVIYQYSIGIVSILAVLMIMIAGIIWLTAGGSPEKVTTAKNFISGAIIGLLLVLFSYILLQTINPNLTTLEVPAISKIVGIEQSDKMSRGDVCYTISDKEKCEAACEGCECHPFKIDQSISDVKDKIRGALRGVINTLTFDNVILKYVIFGPSVVALEGQEQLEKALPGGEGVRGLCYAEANRNVEKGGPCAENKHCVSNFCVPITSSIGACSDGAERSLCKNDSDCDTNSGLKCTEGSLGLKWCAPDDNRKNNSPCDNDSQCKSGVCAEYVSKGICLDGKTSECTFDNDCYNEGGYECVRTPVGGQCTNKYK